MFRTIYVASELYDFVCSGETEGIEWWAPDATGQRRPTKRQAREQTPDEAENDREGSGPLLWKVYAQPTKNAPPEVVQVTVAADHKPVLTPLGRIAFDNLVIENVYAHKATGQVRGQWAALSVRDLGNGNGNGQSSRPGMSQPKGPDAGKGDSKPEGQAA